MKNETTSGEVFTLDVDDLIVDYIRRSPATMKEVASHFGMRLVEAHVALVQLEDAGRLEPHGRLQWKISR